MTFKEFCDWCNDRACDGNWSADTAKICCLVAVTIRKVCFWRRERLWRMVNKELKIEEFYVKPTQERIKVLLYER